MSGREEWTLYVDETGKFDDPEDTCAVVGFLVAVEDEAAFAQVLKKSLEQVYPRTPYPPHATDLWQPSTVLAGWILTHDRAPDPRADGAALDRLGAYALEAPRPELSGFQAAIAERRMPTRDEALKADAILETAAGADFDAVRDYGEVLRKRRKELFHLLAQGLGRGRGFISESAEPREFTSAEGEPRDRYLRLLTILLERVLCFLRRPRPVRLSLWVAERGRMDEKRKVSAADVAYALERARAHPRLAANLLEVEAGPIEVQDYRRPTVSPGIVIADAVGNLTRLLARSRSWPAYVKDARRRVALPFDAATGSDGTILPAVTPTGPSRAALWAHLAGTPVPGASDAEPGWALDQLSLWIAATTPKRGEGAA